MCCGDRACTVHKSKWAKALTYQPFFMILSVSPLTLSSRLVYFFCAQISDVGFVFPFPSDLFPTFSAILFTTRLLRFFQFRFSPSFYLLFFLYFFPSFSCVSYIVSLFSFYWQSSFRRGDLVDLLFAVDMRAVSLLLTYFRFFSPLSLCRDMLMCYTSIYPFLKTISLRAV